jgi:hypothetical protein
METELFDAVYLAAAEQFTYLAGFLPAFYIHGFSAGVT